MQPRESTAGRRPKKHARAARLGPGGGRQRAAASTPRPASHPWRRPTRTACVQRPGAACSQHKQHACQQKGRARARGGVRRGLELGPAAGRNAVELHTHPWRRPTRTACCRRRSAACGWSPRGTSRQTGPGPAPPPPRRPPAWRSPAGCQGGCIGGCAGQGRRADRCEGRCEGQADAKGRQVSTGGGGRDRRRQDAPPWRAPATLRSPAPRLAPTWRQNSPSLSKREPLAFNPSTGPLPVQRAAPGGRTRPRCPRSTL